MEKLSRRSLLARSPLPLLAAAGPDTTSSVPRKLNVVVVGAHVDDPQSSCGGTMARLADLGHEVIALSLTRGDSASIAASLHMDPQELASKRCADALRSCALLRCTASSKMISKSERSTDHLLHQ
jgi:LmbE family N-acetylglucosaminyl deacetylase